MICNGTELASLQIEKDNKPICRFCPTTLNILLNDGIRNRVINYLKVNSKIEKFTTQFLTINNMKIEKGTKVYMKFLISLQEDYYNIYKNKFEAYVEKLDIKEFFNYIVDLYEEYAYELDTEIDNIKIELTEIQVMKGVKIQ